MPHDVPLWMTWHMLRVPTVLVLGAGSSAEFELPAGPKLAESIAKAVNFHIDAGWVRSGDDDLWQALRQHGPAKADAYVKAGRRIATALPLSHSIDDFLYIHGEDQAVVD